MKTPANPLVGGGDMGDVMRELDWSDTPLGVPRRWPRTLLTAAQMVLDGPLPQVLMWGPECIVCACNDAFFSLLRSGPEALGRSFFEVWPEGGDVVAEPLRAGLRGERSSYRNQPFTLLRQGDMQLVYADFGVAPVRDEAGCVRGVVITAVETTDLVLAQRQLRHSEQHLSREREFLESMLAHAKACIAVLQGEQLRYVRVNPAYQALWPGVEMLGRTYAEIFPETAAAGAEALLRDVLRSGVARGGQGIAAPLPGRPDARWDYQVTRLSLAEGEEPAVLLLAWDVTEHLNAAEALRVSDRRKDEFLATLAHELRNPLAPLRSGLEILTLMKHDPRSVDRVRDMMHRQIEHLVRLVEDLLDISRISRGVFELRRRRVPLDEIVQMAVETVRPLLEKAGHKLTVIQRDPSMEVDADEVRLTQALTNLLSNAGKFTEPGGKIWLTVARQDGDAVISVRDTGKGIAPEQLPTVFDLFEKGDRALTVAHGGLGIGLTLVKWLVEMHQGSVEARSNGLGQGSEFIVKLPLAVAGAEVAAVGEPDEFSLSGQRVIVVDDNVDAADGLAMLLGLVGADARAVYDAASALELLDVFDPQVVFLDIGMPEMDGYEAARRIRAHPAGADVLLVAVTGWGQAEDLRRARDAGFDHHLVKPVGVHDVQRMVASVAGR